MGRNERVFESECEAVKIERVREGMRERVFESERGQAGGCLIVKEREREWEKASGSVYSEGERECETGKENEDDRMR